MDIVLAVGICAAIAVALSNGPPPSRRALLPVPVEAPPQEEEQQQQQQQQPLLQQQPEGKPQHEEEDKEEEESDVSEEENPLSSRHRWASHQLREELRHQGGAAHAGMGMEEACPLQWRERRSRGGLPRLMASRMLLGLSQPQLRTQQEQTQQQTQQAQQSGVSAVSRLVGAFGADLLLAMVQPPPDATQGNGTEEEALAHLSAWMMDRWSRDRAAPPPFPASGTRSQDPPHSFYFAAAPGAGGGVGVPGQSWQPQYPHHPYGWGQEARWHRPVPPSPWDPYNYGNSHG